MPNEVDPGSRIPTQLERTVRFTHHMLSGIILKCHRYPPVSSNTHTINDTNRAFRSEKVRSAIIDDLSALESSSRQTQQIHLPQGLLRAFVSSGSDVALQLNVGPVQQTQAMNSPQPYQVPSGGPGTVSPNPSNNRTDPIDLFTQALTQYGAREINTATQLRKILRTLYVALFDKQTLVPTLNAVLKGLNLPSSGLKKYKQEKIYAIAGSCYSKGDYQKLLKIQSLLFKELPAEAVERIVNGVNASFNDQDSDADFLGTTPQSANYTHSTPLSAVIGPSPGQNGSLPFNPHLTMKLPNPNANQHGTQNNAPILLFKSSPFYKLVSQLTRPAITSKAGNRNQISTSIGFQNTIPSNSYNTRLFLVCQKYSTVGTMQPQPIAFPYYIEIRVDGTKLNVDTRGVKGCVGSAKPVDVTPYLLNISSAEKSHEIRLTMHLTEHNQSERYNMYAFAVFRAITKSETELVNELKQRPHISADITRKMAIQSADMDSDDILMNSDAIYSLKDKVMMSRIQVPIRTRQCKHIDCFDALSYIMLQSQAETWKCPICNIIINWESLAVDEFFEEIIANVPSDMDSVRIKSDGTWVGENEDLEDNTSLGNRSRNIKNDSVKSEYTMETEAALEQDIVDLLSDTDDDSFNLNASSEINNHNPFAGRVSTENEIDSAWKAFNSSQNMIFQLQNQAQSHSDSGYNQPTQTLLNRDLNSSSKSSSNGFAQDSFNTSKESHTTTQSTGFRQNDINYDDNVIDLTED